MKHCILFILSVLATCPIFAKDTLGSISLEHKGGDHSEHYLPADAPEAYFDADNMLIIIVADGFASYYDVDIYPENSTIPVLWDTVNGTYDTVDVSSLVPDEYRIVITSEYNNEYEGYFIVE